VALADHTCVAIDLYSPGRGDWAGLDSPAGLARATLAVLDALGLRRFALVGNSMGGYVAEVIATTWPERVSALVLVGVGARVQPSAAGAENQRWLAGPPDAAMTRERVTRLFRTPPPELDVYVRAVQDANRDFYRACSEGAAGLGPARSRLRWSSAASTTTWVRRRASMSCSRRSPGAPP
jgi:pimeloyl-ACP methyl ester carboxylesterase